jgi:hypothetical protein
MNLISVCFERVFSIFSACSRGVKESAFGSARNQHLSLHLVCLVLAFVFLLLVLLLVCIVFAFVSVYSTLAYGKSGRVF